VKAFLRVDILYTVYQLTKMKVYSRDMALTDDDLNKLDLMMKKAAFEGTTEALEAVVFPKFEEIEKRIDGVEESLGNKIGVLERKLDQVTDHQAVKLDDHEKRLGVLENAALT